ncbi:12700_t:CDS:2, partial [Ambispora gerdemannii]
MTSTHDCPCGLDCQCGSSCNCVGKATTFSEMKADNCCVAVNAPTANVTLRVD